MQTVTSTDGTEIAYASDGTGPPLVLVHGGSATHESFDPLLAHLREQFTVVRPDRRGRGESGDGEDYALQREVEDLTAVLGDLDGDPIVFGHSFGGLVTLATALDGTATTAGVVLYEPAVLVGDARKQGDLADRMEAALDEGDRERAMELFFREGGGVPEPQALPDWPEQINFHLTETVVRENRVVERFALPTTPDLGESTLLLTGEHGPAQLKAGIGVLDERLPEARLIELDGVGHVATETAPERVAEILTRFADET